MKNVSKPLSNQHKIPILTSMDFKDNHVRFWERPDLKSPTLGWQSSLKCESNQRRNWLDSLNIPNSLLTKIILHNFWVCLPIRNESRSTQIWKGKLIFPCFPGWLDQNMLAVSQKSPVSAWFWTLKRNSQVLVSSKPSSGRTNLDGVYTNPEPSPKT